MTNIFPIFSDDKRIKRIAGILQGILESGNNAVIFRNTPEVWFQYYFGLYMERPTFVIIQKRDLNSVVAAQLENSLVELTVVDEFNEEAINAFGKNIQEGIKK